MLWLVECNKEVQAEGRVWARVIMNVTVEKHYKQQHQLGELKGKASKNQMQPVFPQWENEVDTLTGCKV